MTYLSNILSKNAFPKSVFSLSQDELYGQDQDHLPLKLSIKKGCQMGKTEEDIELPEDIHGHVFIIAAAGSVELDQENQEKGYIEPAKAGFTSLFNGDGILYRIDFHKTSKVLEETLDHTEQSLKHEQGSAWLASRILKTPDYFIDQAIYQRVNKDPSPDPSKAETWKKLEFKTSGIARVSIPLGTRNQLNTALLRLQLKDGERLLATWDNGRPFEVDPYSLKLIGPVGNDTDWISMVNPIQTQPLKAILTSAHPVFDPHTGEFFTTNASKTLLTLLKPYRLILNGTRELWQLISKMPPRKPKGIQTGAENSRLNFILSWGRRFIFFLILSLIVLPLWVVFGKGIDYLLKWIGFDKGKNEVYIIQWNPDDSPNSLSKWKVILPNGAKIEQTVHQIGLTQDYIIICDTAFKVMPELFIPDFAGSFIHDFLDEIRHFLTYPQLPFTKFYIISRKELADSPNGEVKAVQVKLPREIAHFEVDYSNHNNQITLFAANINATDPAEYIRGYDESVYASKRGATMPEKHDFLYYLLGKAANIIKNLFGYPSAPVPIEQNPYAGHCCAPTDVNTVGCYLIDAQTGEFIRGHDDIFDVNRTWALSFPAYRDRRLENKPIENIYWGAWGLWNSMLSADIYDLYENYKHRIVPIQDVKILAAVGIPSSISHIQVQRQAKDGEDIVPKIKFNAKNYYDFPQGYFGTSPTFVPKVNSVSDDDGYLVCTVIYSDELDSVPSCSASKWSQNSEIWIFATLNLTQGPLYCLSHPNLNFGLTIHTAWLETLPSRSRDDYDIELDYQEVKKQTKGLKLVQETGLSHEIEQIFQEDVFPNFK